MATPPNFGALSVESATVVVQPSAWQRARRNGSVRWGGLALAVLLVVALLAPWLGTVDPWLGIPVTWGQICGARVIVEATQANVKVELSQGSHYFHNIKIKQDLRKSKLEKIKGHLPCGT